jgi:hypothetical protein
MAAGGFVGREELTRDIVTCVPAGRGAWTIALLTMEEAKYGERAFQGAWALAYVAPDGKVTRACDAPPKRAAPGQCEGFEVGVRGGVTPLEIVASDLDGDGVAEVVVTTRSCWDEGAGCRSEITVSAFRDGNIVRYPPASKLVPSGVEDVDHDGRLDLVVNAPWVAPFSDCFANDHTLLGPRLLAHARPDGTFSTSDEVAARFARASCENAPEGLIVKAKESGEVDYYATGEAVACARMRGVSTASILGELRVGCAGFAPVEPCPEKPPPPKTCPDWLLAWAKADPPVLIGPR